MADKSLPVLVSEPVGGVVAEPVSALPEPEPAAAEPVPALVWTVLVGRELTTWTASLASTFAARRASSSAHAAASTV